MARGEAVSWKLWQNFRIKSFTFLVALCGNPYNHSHHGFELESRDRCAVSNKGWEFREQILNRIRPWAGFDPEHSSSYQLYLTIEEKNRKLRLILGAQNNIIAPITKAGAPKCYWGTWSFEISLLRKSSFWRGCTWPGVYYGMYITDTDRPPGWPPIS